MAIKKVVVTYDFTDETYEVFFRKEPNLILAHMGNITQNQMDQQLFGHLRDLGVEVDMQTHEEGADITSTITDLEARLESADVVFHQTPRVAFEIDESEWKGTYQKAIEDLVHSKFLGKSEFSSNDINYSEKQVAAKIAKDASVPMPKSWSVDDYLSSDRQLPVIMKANWSTCGQGIYFIDKHEQIDRFFNSDLYDLSWMGTPDKEDYEVQEVIETPSNHFTHYRIFTLGDGTIVGAVMSVSGNKKDELERVAEPGPFGLGSNIYNCVDSPVYMDCLKAVSNHAQGGSQIAFNANGDSKPLTENDKEVLVAHGYDSLQGLRLNPKLEELAVGVAREFSKFGVIYSGQDWMQDQQGNFHFIEINAGPGMEIFNTLYNHGEGDDKTGMAIGTRKLAEALVDYQVDSS